MTMPAATKPLHLRKPLRELRVESSVNYFTAAELIVTRDADFTSASVGVKPLTNEFFRHATSRVAIVKNRRETCRR